MSDGLLEIQIDLLGNQGRPAPAGTTVEKPDSGNSASSGRISQGRQYRTVRLSLTAAHSIVSLKGFYVDALGARKGSSEIA